jgi:hypothetical protein
MSEGIGGSGEVNWTIVIVLLFCGVNKINRIGLEEEIVEDEKFVLLCEL